MSYNILELPPVGHAATGAAGVTVVSLAENLTSLTWVYLHADLRHNDSSDRVLSIMLLSLSGSGNLVVSDAQTHGGTGLTSDRHTIQRPIIVGPGERLRGLTDALTTTAQLFMTGVYVEVPAHQVLAKPF